MARTIVVLLAVALLMLGGCGKQKKAEPAADIHTAAYEGNVEAIQSHVEAGSDLNVKDQFGSTPLIVATTFGKTEAAVALIEGGADLEMKSGDGSTPLHVAAFLCREEILAALIEHGADKSALNGYGSTALQSVQAPFMDVKPFYDGVGSALAPFGLELDYDRIREARPRVAAMLQK